VEPVLTAVERTTGSALHAAGAVLEPARAGAATSAASAGPASTVRSTAPVRADAVPSGDPESVVRLTGSPTERFGVRAPASPTTPASTVTDALSGSSTPAALPAPAFSTSPLDSPYLPDVPEEVSAGSVLLGSAKGASVTVAIAAATIDHAVRPAARTRPRDAADPLPECSPD
jgi:hypothetical protein